MNIIKKGIELNPTDESARYHLALANIALGDIKEAKQELEDLLGINPENLKVRVDLAVLELFDHNYEKARSYLEECLCKKPEFAKALYYKGLALYELKERKKAKEILNDEIKLSDKGFSEKAEKFLKDNWHNLS